MAIARGAVVSVGACVVLAVVVGGLMCRNADNARKPFLADSYIADGMEDAQDKAPGAELHSIEATFVTPDGRVHTEYGGELDVSWVAPGDAATTAAMPGAPRRGGDKCHDVFLSVELREDSDGVGLIEHMGINRNFDCWKPTAPGPLHCTIVAIWQRALEAKAPNPAMATIKLETTADKKRTWHFTVADKVVGAADKVLFSADFPDDCLPRVER